MGKPLTKKDESLLVDAEDLLWRCGISLRWQMDTKNPGSIRGFMTKGKKTSPYKDWDYWDASLGAQDLAYLVKTCLRLK